MKRFTVLFFILFPLLFVHSQTVVSEEEKQGWYEDYDQFLDIVENANPQLEVRKLVTGENILDTLRCKRKEIESFKSLKEFYDFFYFALRKLNDSHAFICTWNGLLNKGLDSVFIQQAMSVSQGCGFFPKNRFSEEYFPIYLDYVNGEYVLTSDFYAVNRSDSTDSFLLPIGSIIKTLNGKSVESYFGDQDIDFRWDNKLKKRYTEVLGSFYENLKVDKPVFISYLDEKNNPKEFVYDHEKYKCILKEPDYFYYDSLPKKVEYFENEKILYIRNPSMYGSTLYYLTEIYLQAKDKEIDKVIWDIRRNGGGSTRTWMEILRILVKDTITYTYDLAYLDTDLVYDKIKARIGNSGKLKKLPFLEKTYKVSSLTVKLPPYELSIGYGGPIYVLQDNMTYSASGAFAALAHKVNQLKTVGIPTGYILGFGVTPSIFQLKHTHITFTMELTIDASDIKDPYDYYHDEVEIPVELTREDWVKYWQTPNDSLYTKDFLFNHDPIFRKALEQ